jgi:hypothetical protein
VVDENAFIGFGDRAKTELVKNTRFPNLYHLARELIGKEIAMFSKFAARVGFFKHFSGWQ